MTSAAAPRRVEGSLTTMTEFVLPTHANALGTVFGGQVMAWIDLCAAMCAQRHTGSIVITAGIDELSFERTIRVGQVVMLEARVTATFRTSLEILVSVHGEDATTRETWRTVTAYVSFVAVDDALRPRAVPPLLIETDAQRALQAAAGERRARHLAHRQRG